MVEFAHVQLDRLEDMDPHQSKAFVACATACGIAAQRAIDLAKHADTVTELPTDMPEDDDEKRQLVLKALWLRARAGSASATRDLATKLGIETAKSQGIEVVFSDEVASLCGDVESGQAKG